MWGSTDKRITVQARSDIKPDPASKTINAKVAVEQLKW
jgi:hypothetical protein